MWLSAFLLGLLGSFHCVGMCGPIAFLLPFSKTNKTKKGFQIITYHLGRIFAYSCIGLIFGMAGKGLSLFGFQQKLSIIIGAIMIIIVILPVNYSNKLKVSQTVYRLTAKVKSELAKALKKEQPDTFLTLGFLNGFLPCGLVYMAVFGAIATGSPFRGGLYMALFGLGTIPLMTSAVYLWDLVNKINRKRVQKIIPVVVIIIGILFIVRGLGLGIPYLSPSSPILQQVSNTLNCTP